MNFTITYNLFSSNKFKHDDAKSASNTNEAIQLLDSLQIEDDDIYIFIEDISSRVHVHLEEGLFFFQLHMTNGMYEVLTDKGTITKLLKNLESVTNSPLSFGLNAVSL